MSRYDSFFMWDKFLCNLVTWNHTYLFSQLFWCGLICVIAVLRCQTDASGLIGQAYPCVGGWQAVFERFSLEYMVQLISVELLSRV